jgi:Amt family ammonium transporter
VGGVAGALFVYTFTLFQNKFPRIDDVLGVWPLHGLCGLWGGIAAGIFGLESLGGMGGVTFMSQLVGSLSGVAVALIGGFTVYGLVGAIAGLRLTQEEEYNGADLSIHKIASTSED